MDDSLRNIGWNLLAKALSFSKYAEYSSVVVAPIHLKSSLKRAGLRIAAISELLPGIPEVNIV
ncbi:MAG: hypothetical protein UR32_C0026G0003 [candidate division WS6 bacterium GW2011_GWE2_33_157]|nr:MAG: hypothetical protein UR32_C0026G0003 [candidate division WS6 bacterium GW2011_GWE2_33_157]KKP53071.1 MAG: hypothetical protein UR45_C0032G0003 [candidate division WS6 bacterium GW2011_WS6_33_547]